MDVALLCLAGGVQSVDAGFVSYESRFGLCPHYRRSVEQGQVHANSTPLHGDFRLRAAACGLPFMPVAVCRKATSLRHRYFASVRDPFSDRHVSVVRALRPDWAILHAQYADELEQCAHPGADVRGHPDEPRGCQGADHRRGDCAG